MPRDRGFTLVELLVVIVVLGVLATITVFAVRGITDQGHASAAAADQRTLVGAEEAHLARFNTYATEADLVGNGLLASESSQYDIDLAADGDSYTIVAEGSLVTATTVVTGPTTPTTEVTVPTTEPPAPPTALDVTVAGFAARSFGTGAHRIVVISDGVKMAGGFEQLVAAGTPLPTTQVIYITEPIDSVADVNAILGAGATYFVAADSVAIGGGQFVGTYLDTQLGADEFWWSHNQGDFNSMLVHYRTHIVPGG